MSRRSKVVFGHSTKTPSRFTCYTMAGCIRTAHQKLTISCHGMETLTKTRASNGFDGPEGLYILRAGPLRIYAKVI